MLIASSISIYALDKKRTLDQFNYQTWQTGSGLPQNTVHSILQARDGFLWFATEGGLVRFDGYQFTVFDARHTPALKSDFVKSLLEDQDGSLWVATAAGLCRRVRGNFETAAADLQLPTDDILALHRDGSGRIWAIGPGAASSWSSPERQGVRAQVLAIAEGSPRLTGAIASDNKGTIWLGTQAGLKGWNGREWVEAPCDLPREPVATLLLDRKGRLWAGTKRGVFVARERDRRHFEPLKGALATTAALALFEDWEGAIWLGTETGLGRVAEDGQTVQAGRALSGVPVIAMAEDAEGDLWAGTESGGITIVRNQKFTTYTTRNGLADEAVRCVFESHNGVVSVGTNAGVAQLIEGQFKKITSAVGLSSNVVLSLGEDREGNLLAGTPDGLNTISAKGVSVITSADGLADDFVRSIYRDRDDSLWFGTRRGLSHRVEGRFVSFTQADGLGSDLAGTILRDSHGDLWVGTLGGLSRLENGRFTNYRTRDGLSSDVITALHEDRDGDLWIGTRDAGLNVRMAGKIRRLPSTVGLPDAVYGIAEDDNGELWISSNAGIARANRQELKSVAEGRSTQGTAVWYGTSDGLQVAECSIGGHPEVWKTKDGAIWFSTVKGASVLYPEAARLNRVLPPVVIESVTIDDQTFRPDEVHEVSPGHARFVFEYAGLSFAAPQKVRYRYKLEGLDKEWIEAGTQRVASYTNIRPGTYNFRVVARNNDGFWNESGAVMTFHLTPHFYQTVWFYAAALLLLACAAYWIYRWRVAEVEARFGAVLQERNRIAREIHDTLAQGFVGVSMQLEIVSRLLSSSTDSAREHLDQARVLVREGLSEARRSIWQLRSQSAESQDFASRLSKAATQVIGMSPVKLTLEVSGTNRALDGRVEDELLSIGKEAVTNAVRHADAKRIAIELAFQSKRLRMTIADDGRGFTMGSYAAGPNGHFGLQGMRERAQQINAELTVDSSVGEGTKVLVEAPLS